MALTAAAAAKIAATVLTNDKLRKTVGWIIAAVLSPLIVLLVIVCSFMSGGANHNIEALDLSYYGGMIAGSVPEAYRQHIVDMQTSLAIVDSEIASVNAMAEGGNGLDSHRVKAIFYSLYFGAENPTAVGIGQFVDCFVSYEQRTDSESGESYTVAVPLPIETAYANIQSVMGIPITDAVRENVTAVMLRTRSGGDTFSGEYLRGDGASIELDISAFTDPNTKNNLDLVAYAVSAWENGWGYVWGTCGWVLTDSLFESKLAQYPDGVGNYEDFIRENWLGGRATDCVGLIKGYGWLDISDMSIGYAINGMPDVGADGMYNAATVKGDMSTINGIPIVALELKNQLTGQDYLCAIKQYKNDRSSKEFCFRLNHRFLVYFAVDLYEAWMATQLLDGKTYFMPFNQGSNGAGNTGGAGNPASPNGYATSYLWENVLQRDCLMDIIHRFISFVSEKEEITVNGATKTVKKEKLIFPRYHQYDVVKKVLADVSQNGVGSNYLIQHSAGSGKSNSIAWIAYRLASLHDADNNGMFHSVIVVTNRIVLDGQLQDTINSFEHQVGLVEAIDDKKNSRSLAEAINDKKRIIICTIQKFLFAYKDMEKFSGRRFAIIVDEAHQGQNGESAKILRRSLIDMGVAIKDYAEEAGIDESEVDLTDEYVNAVIGQGKHENQSFFAFTATPKGQTLELFGRKDPATGNTVPFHVYSMRQAIEEGYILDVLANYTTIKEAFKLIKVSEDNPELIEGPASRALFKYYKEHGYTITQKTEMIMSNFLANGRYQIGGKGKAMVVADSRANAVRYYFAIRKYLKDHPQEAAGSDVMIAFSGEVSLEDMPAEKPYTEATMNLDETGKYITTDKKFRRAFHSSQYNIMVVANKYQTGFDEPLLHSMFVDKKLRDVTAVQTLSRLNRTSPGKTNTFVLDFENTEEDIKDAFLPYYEATALAGDTDVNKVYDLRNKLRDFMLYNWEDVDAFNKFMASQIGRGQDAAALGRLASLFRPIIDRYNELTEDERYTVRDFIRKFNGAYSYVTQLVRLHDKDLFSEFQYTSHLVRLLPRVGGEIIDIDDKIKLEYASLTETFKGAIVLDEKPPVIVPIDGLQPRVPNKKRDTLQSIIDKVNERFDGRFTDADRVIIEGIYQMFMKDSDVKKFKKYAKDNSTEMFVRSLFPDKFKDIVTQCFLENNDSFQKLFNDPDFYQKVQDAMAAELYKALRKD